MVAARAWRAGTEYGKVLVKGHKVLVMEDGKILEVYCTAQSL